MSRRWTATALAVATAGAIVHAGCSSDDKAAAPRDVADGAPDSTSPEASPPTVDAATPPVDTGVADAGIDTGPPFDCTGDVPDAGDGGAVQAPTNLRCTTLYSDWNTKTVATDARAYTPGYVLWSDGAVKSRWAQLPAGQKIDATNPDEWTFPVGTKFWKEFQVGGRRVETRLFWKASATEWVRTTYQWSADGSSSATRLDTGSGGPAADAGLIDDGGVEGGLDGAAAYEIPSVQKCDGCHSGRLDKILGFEAVALGAPGATGVTLATLKSEGLLTAGGAPSTLPATLTIPEDTTGRARNAIGWLHTNCGVTCHNKNPSATCAFNSIRLRVGVAELALPDGGAPTVQALEIYQTTHDVPASTGLGDPAFKPYARFTHGDPTKSLVRYLIGRRTTTEMFGQMPPVDSHVVDVNDLAAIDAWIVAMP